MTLRERMLAVYRGETPEVVPYMLDLSHWFYHRNRLPWDLSRAYEEPEYALIDCHRELNAGFYMPNLGSFYDIHYPDDVRAKTEKRTVDGGTEIAWRLETSLGTIERTRIWEEATYAWGINGWGIRDETDLRIFAQAMGQRRFSPCWDRYQAWVDYVGDTGVVYMSAGYSTMGHLLNLWMGIGPTVYAIADWPDLMQEVVATVNGNNLDLIDLLCESPAEVIMMGDNFSSDIQPPHFFEQWSQSYYSEAIERLHRAGKKVAVHIDGQLRGALTMIREAGADCGDAITSTPMGDLSPAQCRDEAGPEFILSGGVSPDLWLPQTPLKVFEEKVLEWLALKDQSPRLIAGAGDQVPPGAEERRIALMSDLVEEHGRF